MLDLEQLSKEIDEMLAKETPETINAWLASRINNVSHKTINYTSQDRHIDSLKENISKLLYINDYSSEELELIYEVVKNVKSFKTVIQALKNL